MRCDEGPVLADIGNAHESLVSMANTFSKGIEEIDGRKGAGVCRAIRFALEHDSHSIGSAGPHRSPQGKRA
jgi:hypothetical protein